MFSYSPLDYKFMKSLRTPVLSKQKTNEIKSYRNVSQLKPNAKSTFQVVTEKYRPKSTRIIRPSQMTQEFPDFPMEEFNKKVQFEDTFKQRTPRGSHMSKSLRNVPKNQINFQMTHDRSLRMSNMSRQSRSPRPSNQSQSYRELSQRFLQTGQTNRSQRLSNVSQTSQKKNQNKVQKKPAWNSGAGRSSRNIQERPKWNGGGSTRKIHQQQQSYLPGRKSMKYNKRHSTIDNKAELTKQGKNTITNVNDLNNFFLPFYIPEQKQITRAEKLKEEYSTFHQKVYYTLISSELQGKIPDKYLHAQRVEVKMNENEMSNYQDHFYKIRDNKSRQDIDRWNDLFKRYYQMHRILNFDLEQPRDSKYVLKVFQYQFNSNKHSSSIFCYVGAALPNGNLLLQSQGGKRHQVNCKDVINLWKKRTSQQKHLLIILDCNYSQYWVKCLADDPDHTISIQGSTLYDQQAKYGQLGGYFTHNYMKLIDKRSKETIIIPSNQELCFQGSLLQIKKYTNLLMYFKNWGGLETNVKYSFQCQFGEEVQYNGQIWKGSRNGWGFQRWTKGDLLGAWYNGQFKNGKFSGLGMLKKPNGVMIEGQFKNNRVHGYAIEYDDNIYEGEWYKNIKKGKGVLKMKNGSVYTGDFDKDKPNGTGELITSSGTRYYGEFVNGQCHGLGEIEYNNGDIYKGQWRQNEKHGQGFYRFSSGDVYQGYFENGVQSGKGVYREYNGENYRGNYEKGRLHGEGWFTFQNGDFQDAQWKNGKLQKKMVFYDSKSQRIVYQFNFLNILLKKIITNNYSQCFFQIHEYINIVLFILYFYEGGSQQFFLLYIFPTNFITTLFTSNSLYYMKSCQQILFFWFFFQYIYSYQFTLYQIDMLLKNLL